MNKFPMAFGAAMALMTVPAMAHTGVGAVHGLLAGFLHPLTGIDHILTMIAVGLFAGQIGGRALWMLPLSFAAMMAAGGVLGIMGAPLPGVETGIGASVVALGLAVALDFRPDRRLAAGLAGLFAVFHGHAHGAEIPLAALAIAYATGFLVATAVLHGVGIGLWAGLNRLAISRRRVAGVGGAGMALAGVGLLAGWL